MAEKTVLFLCSGNYYRSRFAEVLFNTLAGEAGWRAASRGLSTSFGKWKAGPMSQFAVSALKERRVALPGYVREPLYCCEADLLGADLVIALKEAEHRPLLMRHFPDHCATVEYWHVHDVDVVHPEQALGELDGLVRKLVDRLAVDKA